MCSGAGRDRDRFGATGAGAPYGGWGPPGADRYSRDRWGDPARAHPRTASDDRRRPSGGPPRNGRPGPFVGPAIVLAFMMATFVAPTSPHAMPLFPLLIFPVIAALMITRRHRPRPQHLRGTRSYREAVPAPWNRPDEHFDEAATQRTAITSTTKAAPSWPTPAPEVRSPFDKPAFWDEDPSASRQLPVGRDQNTPPAWDPLGVAPFAWDLPEPPPRTVPKRRRRQAVVARMAAGTAVLVCASAVIGDVAGWWPLSTVIAASWAVIALVIGLLIGSHHRRATADR